MTEIRKISEVNDIHWLGFFAALLAAPALLASVLIGPLWLLDLVYHSQDLRSFMGILSVLSVIGATLYFCIGTPVLIYHLRRHAPQVGRIVGLSLVSLLWMLPIGAAFSIAIFEPGPIMFAAISMGFGLIGAPPLAALFTLVYLRFVRP
ncbi:hypothetical protein [uncultured Sulfitobacter sp.]|uniref:hypothetical protein n=1 Tax=uncultured Sulfitobacter sp. TaxID=191468 RepID=UPI00262C28C6|nr:hypothetical protein [uncultured Sulfitobacter sp.]